MSPRINTAGVSNAGPVEEPQVVRANGMVEEVRVPAAEATEPEHEEKREEKSEESKPRRGTRAR